MKCRNITICLKSQYDHLTIPEFIAPLSIFHTPPRRLPTADSITCIATPTQIPASRDDSYADFSTPIPPRTVTAYVPVYPGSQFWIHYTCPEPDDPDIRFYYFKLFVRGQCLLSWGVGEENDFQGRLAFGVYDGGDDFQGKRVLEKRAFFFPMADGGARRSGSMEVKVYRSRARRREVPKYEKFNMSGNERQSAFSMSTSGRMRKGEPKKMYSYALLDPTDQPYCVFKYNFRSGNQLRELGVTLPPGATAIDDIMSTSPDRREHSPISPLGSLTLSPPIPGQEYAPPRQPDFGLNAKAMHPLSLPPRMRFSPAKARVSREAQPSPVKKNMPRPESPLLGNLHHNVPTLRKSRLPMRSPMMKLNSNKPLPKIAAKDEEYEPARVYQAGERGVNALDARNRSVAKVAEDIEKDSPANALVKTFSTAMRSLKRRVGSREEAKMG